MSSNTFLKQEATRELIENVAHFCSECYEEIEEHSTVFYNMQNCCYLCESCQKREEEEAEHEIAFDERENSSLFL